MILKQLFRENQEVVTLTSDARIAEAAELMRAKRIGSIVILDDGQIIGIITDRDIALSVTLGAATADSFVSEVMSKNVKTVREDATLFDASRHFRMEQVKRLPVIDREERLVGIVSTDDLMAVFSKEMFDTCRSLETKLGHLV